MNDCCASSSANASATLPSYTVRPDVTFPDWSVVTSALVKDALLAMNDALRIMAGPNQPADRWGDRDRLVDQVRVALLKLYAEAGRAPTQSAIAKRARLSETTVQAQIEELHRRDLVVLNGDRIVGAYPFTDRDADH